MIQLIKPFTILTLFLGFILSIFFYLLHKLITYFIYHYIKLMYFMLLFSSDSFSLFFCSVRSILSFHSVNVMFCLVKYIISNEDEHEMNMILFFIPSFNARITGKHHREMWWSLFCSFFLCSHISELVQLHLEVQTFFAPKFITSHYCHVQCCALHLHLLHTCFKW